MDILEQDAAAGAALFGCHQHLQRIAPDEHAVRAVEEQPGVSAGGYDHVRLYVRACARILQSAALDCVRGQYLVCGKDRVQALVIRARALSAPLAHQVVARTDQKVSVILQRTGVGLLKLPAGAVRAVGLDVVIYDPHISAAVEDPDCALPLAAAGNDSRQVVAGDLRAVREAVAHAADADFPVRLVRKAANQDVVPVQPKAVSRRLERCVQVAVVIDARHTQLAVRRHHDRTVLCDQSVCRIGDCAHARPTVPAAMLKDDPQVLKLRVSRGFGQIQKVQIVFGSALRFKANPRVLAVDQKIRAAQSQQTSAGSVSDLRLTYRRFSVP